MGGREGRARERGKGERTPESCLCSLPFARSPVACRRAPLLLLPGRLNNAGRRVHLRGGDQADHVLVCPLAGAQHNVPDLPSRARGKRKASVKQ